MRENGAMGTNDNATALASTYLINLDRSTDRLQRFNVRNSHLRHVVRMSAIDGTQIDRKQLIASGRVLSDLRYSAGTLSCALSHIQLWELAIAKSKPVTIFEDDIATHPHFQKCAADVLAALPNDWDFVQWGCMINSENNLTAWVDLGRVPVRIDSTAPVRWRDDAGYRAFQEEPLMIAAPVRMIHSWGLFAYSISIKGARLAIEHCLPLREQKIAIQNRPWKDSGLDVKMCALYPRIKAFLSFPQLAIPCLDGSERKTLDAGQ